MSKADEKKLEQMLVDFEKAHPDAGKNFRTLIGETPALKANLLEAIGKGNLEKIGPMPASAPAGALGAYNAADKSMMLPTTLLDVADKDKKLANTMRMVLTHESEHAVNKQAIEAANKAFEGKLTAVSKGPSPHDYTPALKEKADSDRLREATDQVGGFNAVAAHVRKENPTATPAQLYEKLHNSSPEMAPYFDVAGTPPKQTYAPKAGLTIGANGLLAETPANIEAMGKHFYDARPYRQIYGTQALQAAINVEGKEQVADRAADPKYTPPEVRVNLKELGLDGVVAFPAGSGITDTSPRPPPVVPPKSPVTPAEAPHDSSHAAPRDSRAAETAPALYLQSVNALEKLGPDAGIKDRDELGAVAAAMASKAQTDGLRQIDAVVASTDGKGLIAIQGDPGSAQARNSYIDRAEAAQQPMAQSLSQLEKGPPSPAEVASQQQTPAGPSR